MELTRHPLSNAFPSMSDSEQSSLTQDIKENGQRNAIIIYDGQVLDGWHRYQACMALGKVPVTENLSDGVDPVAYVISVNMHRRHLTATQRSFAAVACTEWAEIGRPQKQIGTSAELKVQTTAEMAKSADVSPRTIQDTKTAVKAGFGEELRDGKLSAKKAAELAKPPVIKQPEPLLNDEPPVLHKDDAKETVTIPKEQHDGMMEMIEEYLADAEALANVLDADDQLAESVKEIRRLTSHISVLESQLNGANAKNNELISMVKSLQRQVAKLEKENDKLKIEALPL